MPAHQPALGFRLLLLYLFCKAYTLRLITACLPHSTPASRLQAANVPPLTISELMILPLNVTSKCTELVFNKVAMIGFHFSLIKLPASRITAEMPGLHIYMDHSSFEPTMPCYPPTADDFWWYIFIFCRHFQCSSPKYKHAALKIFATCQAEDNYYAYWCL